MDNRYSATAIRQGLACPNSGCECNRGRNTHCPGPGHRNGDRDPSLTVDPNPHGDLPLVNCKAGCSQADVIAELQARDLWPRRNGHERANGRGPLTIAATYDYRDASGALAFQVVRFAPKGFRQRRPSGDGGWTWKKGDTTILYRLPELLASGDDEIIWLCEGEKDADRLASEGLVATTRAEGAGKWKGPESRWLEGRRVVILADNDEAGRKDVALKLASLRGAASAVAVLDLDALPPGGDVSDWLDLGGGISHLIALGEAALETAVAEARESTAGAEAPTDAATPSPDTASEPDVHPMAAFPTDVLPSSMRRLVEQAAVALAVPPEFVAVPLLVLAGAVIGNAWAVEVKRGWLELPSLYAAVVGDPGSGKSPALKLALKPLTSIQHRLAEEYKLAKRAYDAALAEWESSARSSDRGARPEPPTFRHVWTTDPTTEVLAEMLVGTKGLAYTRDELAGWVASMDAYRSGKGADRQHFLSMWSGAAIKIDRKSRPDPIMAPRPCLSIVGGIQPDVLPALVAKGDTEDGFLDRMLWAYPDLGSAPWNDEGIDESLERAVEDLFARLHVLDGESRDNGRIVPRIARLDAPARVAWQEWFNARREEADADGFPASLKGVWSKLPAQLARVTLILHVVWAVDAHAEVDPRIPLATLAAAADLLDYFKDHARAALASVRTSRASLEDRLVRILRERGPQTSRQLYEALGGRVKADRLNAALERLVEDGRITMDAAPAGPQGGRPAKVWRHLGDTGPVSFKEHARRRKGMS